jgi:GNAT superfamily N-acetyltransferase
MLESVPRAAALVARPLGVLGEALLERASALLAADVPAGELAGPTAEAADDPAADDPAARALSLAALLVADRRTPGDTMREAIAELVGAESVRIVASDVAPSYGARLSGVAARAATEDRPVTGRETVRAIPPDPGGPLPVVLAVPHGRPPDRRVVVVARTRPDFTAAEVARVRALLHLGSELDLLAAAPRPDGMPYPQSWRRDAVLSDGTEVHLRPARNGDAELVAAMHARCSPATVFARFLSPVPRLPGWMLTRLVDADHLDRVVFVALVGEDVVGVGSWTRAPGEDEAELALLVEDAVQGRGLGPLLLERLFAAAVERRLPRLVAVTGAGNGSARKVLVSAGFTAEPSARGDGLVHLVADPALALARPA